MPYETMADWLNEAEGFCLRAERVPSGCLSWIKEAWELAVAAERERCARIAEAQISQFGRGDLWNEACRSVAMNIRSP
jgi:hypothetical protein